MRQTDILFENFNDYSFYSKELQTLEDKKDEITFEIMGDIKRLPRLRELAYPSDKSMTGSDENISLFQVFLKESNLRKTTLREISKTILRSKKRLSLIRYYNLIINKVNIMKEDNKSIYAVSFDEKKNVFSCSWVSIHPTDKKFKTISSMDVEISEIDKFLKLNADYIILFEIDSLLNPAFKEHITLLDNDKFLEENVISLQRMLLGKKDMDLPSYFDIKEDYKSEFNGGAALIMDVFNKATGQAL